MTVAEGIAQFVLTPHALGQMERRGLTQEEVAPVVRQPQQRWHVRPGRDVLQSRFEPGASGGDYLVRVIVDVDASPAEVVTAYRTSKVDKYWRRGQ